MAEETPFDSCGPLPGPGVTVLEASAGTGKTFTLASLVTRYVAEGTPLPSILAVTFTRMATGELRERVRGRLASAVRYLAEPGRHPGDRVLELLGEGDERVVAERLTRLRWALGDFDATTIATTHGFCNMVLHNLGTSGSVPPGVELLDEPERMLREVVEDLFLRRSLLHGTPPFGLADALAATAESVRNPGARLAPGPGDEPAGLLCRLVAAARKEVSRRLASSNLLTYDELLLRLADALDDPSTGSEARRRLRERYRVVLVDEFQDTDPVQWRIVKSAFAGAGTTVILIGDPKQAIYAFRGADVYSYLDAAAAAANRFTLTDNWRAGQGLLDALAALLSPLEFGHPGIPFRTVRTAEGRPDAGLSGAPVSAPLRFRLVGHSQAGVELTARKRLLKKESLERWIASDVAGDIRALLSSNAEADGSPIVASSIAVLTRTNQQAALVSDALRSAGIPAGLSGSDSVFASPAALQWLRLLEALQEPASASRAAGAAASCFFGFDARRLAEAGDAERERVHDAIHRWASILSDRGVGAMYQTVLAEQALPARLLGEWGGERLLTDLGHIAELLRAEERHSQAEAPMLRAWLADRIAAAGAEQAGTEERSRRLDSDAAAVQVMTVHRAKGLEFDVVYCPFLWDSSRPPARGRPFVFHDTEAGNARTLDVGGTGGGPARDAHRSAAAAEQRGEELRVMYVGLTRARHQVVVWWGRAQGSQHSPLGRVLLCRRPDGTVGDARPGEPADSQILAALEGVAGRAPGLVAVEEAAPASLQPNPTPPPSPAELSTARFTRSLDSTWRRASYSSITMAAHLAADPVVASEPEGHTLDDEPPGPADGRGVDGGSFGAAFPGNVAGPGPGGHWPLSPLRLIPGGRAVGTLVHRMLQGVDFSATDVRTVLSDAATSFAPAPAGVDLQILAEGLAAAVTSPLGPLLPGCTLRAVSRRDRLDEMSFELPLAGGDRPSGALTTNGIARVLREHLPATDPLSAYPGELEDPLLAARLRGYMTGSLDLVFRCRPEGAGEKWFLVDYKTNRLGPATGSPETAWHYRPVALAREMRRRHYPLQALIYLVALHRYLSWRLPGYTPASHLGGVLYLFVRGMVGPEAPLFDGHPSGVFSWSPPPGLVVALSALFDGDRS